MEKEVTQSLNSSADQKAIEQLPFAGFLSSQAATIAVVLGAVIGVMEHSWQAAGIAVATSFALSAAAYGVLYARRRKLVREFQTELAKRGS